MEFPRNSMSTAKLRFQILMVTLRRSMLHDDEVIWAMPFLEYCRGWRQMLPRDMDRNVTNTSATMMPRS
ncbi:hypothetical protein LCM4573_26235 [Rhizobium sp. LCM 4573]|nr:hypothetical protein LCM4573_26235 [Rhizobium sp. LCM 4573]